ncbi:MAG: SOS response-associated peptidase, partial [Myxococcota bacterium]
LRGGPDQRSALPYRTRHLLNAPPERAPRDETMCGRFTLTRGDITELAEQLAIDIVPSVEAPAPRFNVAPSQAHWFVRSKENRRELLSGHWGLLNHWAKDPKKARRPINARAETLAEKPSFRRLLGQRRCVVAADGFYEWKGARGRKRPYWIHPVDGSYLWMAGLHAVWFPQARDDDTTPLRTFTVITVPANDDVAPLHDRMPALLSREAVDRWLDDETAPLDQLKPAAAGLLQCDPASRRVNDVAQDDAGLLDPNDVPYGDQLTLFGD